MKAMVLAAGLGTRLQPYTSICPKPLFPILGEPLLLTIIQKLRQSGFDPIVVNAYHLKDQIVEKLVGQPDIILQQEPIELGTGGGLRMALDSLEPGPVLVTNSDIFHEIDYCWAYENHLKNGAGATLVMHNYPRFNKVAVSDKRKVLTFAGDEGENLSARQMAFTGIHVLETELLQSIPLGEFSSIINTYESYISSGGTIKALETDSFWQDIGTPADYLDLHGKLLKQFSVNNRTDRGSSNFVMGKDVVVEDDVTFVEWGYIGKNVHIGRGAHLSRVVVWDGARIEPGTVARDTIIT